MSSDKLNRAEEQRAPLTENDALLPKDGLTELLLSSSPATSLTQQQQQHRRTRSEIGPNRGRRHNKGRHHRHKSSLGELLMDMSKHGLESIREGLHTEASFVRDAWTNELEGVQRSIFLDMSMTRSLSVLPESISDLMEETVGHDSYTRMTEEPTTPAKIAMGPYLGLLGAVLAVSSSGTALTLLEGVPPPMKYFWRMTVTSIALTFFAIPQMFQEGFPKLCPSRWLTMFGAVFCYTAHGIAFVTALQYTSIGNVVIGANSQAMLLIIGKLVLGHEVHWMEGAGVFVAFCGCVLCSGDEARNSAEEEGTDPRIALMGDIIAFSSGLFGILYLTFAKAVRSEMPVTVFMFFVMTFGSWLVILYMAIIGCPMHFNNDPFTGLFGWVNVTENRIYILIYMALVCNMLGTMGFVRAMQYFENIIIAVATLLEPMVATVVAYLVLGADLPGLLGWVGNALVVLGTLGVVYPSANKGQLDGH